MKLPPGRWHRRDSSLHTRISFFIHAMGFLVQMKFKVAHYRWLAKVMQERTLPSPSISRTAGEPYATAGIASFDPATECQAKREIVLEKSKGESPH